MNATRESLPLGWRPGPAASAALCAAVMFAGALAMRYSGLAAGLGVLLAGTLAALGLWRDARIDGPSIRLRGARSGWRAVACHAGAIDRLEYRRSLQPSRLSLHTAGGVTVLRASGPTPRIEAFRQLAMWLIVHGRQDARIDASLLDALAAMPDHARTGQPHDTSHA